MESIFTKSKNKDKYKVCNNLITVEPNGLQNSYLNRKDKKEKTSEWSKSKMKLGPSCKQLDVILNKTINKKYNEENIFLKTTHEGFYKGKNNYNLESPEGTPITQANSNLKDSNYFDSLNVSKFEDDILNLKSTIINFEDDDKIEGIKFVDEMGFVLEEDKNYDEEEYIWDGSIKILNFLSEGAQAKVFLGQIVETESYVAIKRYLINYNEENLNKILEECELIKSIEHKNIIKYFDVEYNIIQEEVKNNEYNPKIMSRIDLIMEFVDGYNLKEYLSKFSSGESGLPLCDVKLIVRHILEGIKHLHDNKIIHRDLKVTI
jgi:hypothetical protein